MELATTTGTEQHDRVISVSDLNDRWPTDDADVIEIKQAMDSTSIALVPIDLTRVAENIMRVADVDGDRGAGEFSPAPPSSGSQALAAVLVFDLDRETDNRQVFDPEHLSCGC